MRTTLKTLVLCFTCFLLTVASAHAEFPSRNFKLIVPYSAGGGTDTMARTIVPDMENAFGKNVVVMNKPGAAGQIGTVAGADSKADGYTLTLLSGGDFLLTLLLVDDAGFDFDSFNYLASFNISANALVLKADSPFNTLEEFIDYAKNNPGKLTIGGSGDAHIFEIIRLEQLAGIELSHIRYSGGGESRNAVLGGHVDGIMIDKRFCEDLAASGAKALAVASDERFAILPDLPTFKEKGFDIDNPMRRVLAVPKDTPADRAQALADAVARFADTEAFGEKLLKIGEVKKYLAGEALVQSLQKQLQSIRAVIEAAPEEFKR